MKETIKNKDIYSSFITNIKVDKKRFNLGICFPNIPVYFVFFQVLTIYLKLGSNGLKNHIYFLK